MLPVFLLVGLIAQAPAPGSTAFQHVVGPTTALRPTESSVIGTIDKFEDTARQLTLKTKDGSKVSFVIASDATIRMGPRTLPLQELATNNGRRAKVRFTMSDGRRTAHWVAVSSEPPREAK